MTHVKDIWYNTPVLGIATMSNGMISESAIVLSTYARWLARNGNKYPRPGCAVSGAQIASSIRDVVDALKCLMDVDDLKMIVGLAKASSPMLGNRKGLSCIARAERAIKRMEERCRRDTESQPRTPQG